RVAENVLHLTGGEGRVGGHVGGGSRQGRGAGQGPLEACFGEDGDLFARREPELAQAQRQCIHARGGFLMRDVAPRAIHFVAEDGCMRPIGLHGVEEQLGQGTRGGAHGRNLTTKVTGEPGTVSPTARRAIAATTTLSGTGAPRSRTWTNAMPDAPVATVSVVTRP